MNYTKSVVVAILYSTNVGLAQAARLLKRKIKRVRLSDANKQNYQVKLINFNTDKHILRSTARHHQLAYAFLRGKKYKTVENCCSPDNTPSSSRITEILKDLMYKYEFERSVISEDKVKLWLTGEV